MNSSETLRFWLLLGLVVGLYVGLTVFLAGINNFFSKRAMKLVDGYQITAPGITLAVAEKCLAFLLHHALQDEEHLTITLGETYWATSIELVEFEARSLFKGYLCAYHFPPVMPAPVKTILVNVAIDVEEKKAYFSVPKIRGRPTWGEDWPGRQWTPWPLVLSRFEL